MEKSAAIHLVLTLYSASKIKEICNTLGKCFFFASSTFYYLNIPISFETAINLSLVREMSTTLIPCLANSLAYSLPMPSVAPVITVEENTITNNVTENHHHHH